MENKIQKFNDWHLYLGCPCKIWFEGESGKFDDEHNGTLSWSHEEGCEWLLVNTPADGGKYDVEDEDFRWKPLLRPLYSMTEDEVYQFAEDHGYWIAHERVTETYKRKRTHTVREWIERKRFNPEPFRDLLSKHFDIFNLIASGQAIDSTTVEKPRLTNPQ